VAGIGQPARLPTYTCAQGYERSTPAKCSVDNHRVRAAGSSQRSLHPAFRAQTIALIDGLHTMLHFNIVSASTTLLADGWKLYSTRLDKEWSLTDCTSFIVMEQENISQAFTSDHHFEHAGFIKLL
jgi:predicted nucleic acid-binding protein